MFLSTKASPIRRAKNIVKDRLQNKKLSEDEENTVDVGMLVTKNKKRALSCNCVYLIKIIL